MERVLNPQSHNTPTGDRINEVDVSSLGPIYPVSYFRASLVWAG